jgi:hypothetical protein
MKWLLLILVACNSALDQRLDVVEDERVLAVQSDPPEVTPGAAVTVSVVVASPMGTIDVAPAWSLCTAPKPPTEDNAVAAGCVATSVTPLGTAITVTTPIPVDACRTYGPDVIAKGFRPRDPDPTGGFYQPVRAAIPDLDLAFGFTRITCDLANAPGQVAQDYLTMYVANQNPTLNAPSLPASVSANSDVPLSISWPDAAAESYLYYDPSSETLITRRESMHVSWFATAGDIAVDASEVAETDLSTSASTTWHTPSSSGTVYLWFVLRDSRGGIATASTMTVVE